MKRILSAVGILASAFFLTAGCVSTLVGVVWSSRDKLGKSEDVAHRHEVRSLFHMAASLAVQTGEGQRVQRGLGYGLPPRSLSLASNSSLLMSPRAYRSRRTETAGSDREPSLAFLSHRIPSTAATMPRITGARFRRAQPSRTRRNTLTASIATGHQIGWCAQCSSHIRSWAHTGTARTRLVSKSGRVSARIAESLLRLWGIAP